MTTTQQGAVFVGTGREEHADHGTIWYEIYLDMDRIMTGWASQKVIEKQ
ncbi:MAG: hypothetical protein K2G55_00495 [Lachnospiraceae bacterium]|nr:hypothetical protein [Lachnospiraceae bacterium]MDE7204641.1 hypothetical protein [Lachnospiraceae bacterium]